MSCSLSIQNLPVCVDLHWICEHDISQKNNNAKIILIVMFYFTVNVYFYGLVYNGMGRLIYYNYSISAMHTKSFHTL